MIKKLIKNIIFNLVARLSKTKIGGFFFELIVSSLMSQTQAVTYQGVSLKFLIPNNLNKFRVDTFASKEPETLEWIQKIPSESILWDIGANIGLYSCFAAAKSRCRVYAFEPSIFNVELLGRNVALNGLSDQVTIVPLPIAGKTGADVLRMTNTYWGGALSTFGESFGYDGQSIKSIFAYSTLGISIDDAISRLNIPKPDYIKLDVDGIEHLILMGGDVTLQSIQGILLEVNENFHEQFKSASSLLLKAGLEQKEKHRWEGSINSNFENTYNQIWVRSRKVVST
jgi:FkbM family methyltransferase